MIDLRQLWHSHTSSPVIVLGGDIFEFLVTTIKNNVQTYLFLTLYYLGVQSKNLLAHLNLLQWAGEWENKGRRRINFLGPFQKGYS